MLLKNFQKKKEKDIYWGRFKNKNVLIKIGDKMVKKILVVDDDSK